MSTRHIFHLSIPVSDLQLAKRFYVEVLGASIGRENSDWMDALLWGHQITLQLRPAEVLPPRQQGKRHFGVTLPWQEWELAAERVASSGVNFLAKPQIFQSGLPDEHAKFFLADPSHNVIEIKAYRDVQAAIGLPSAQV
jgi:extradiol dioxygenase family protein